MKIDLNAMADRYEEELYESIVPFWERYAPDPVHGGFFNLLDRDGSLFGTEKYLWMQWRNVYMFAKLHNDAPAERRRAEWLPLAESGFDFCERFGRAPDGEYYFEAEADGSNPRRGEAHYGVMIPCYAAMAAAQMFRATGEKRHRNAAAEALAQFVADFRAFEMRTGCRKFGIYMHLCCVATEVLGALGDGDGSVRRLLEEALGRVPEFREPRTGRRVETMGLDGRFRLESPLGRLVISGHGFEAMWFMAEGAKLIGKHEVEARIPEWTREICSYALDRKEGGVFSMQDAFDRPLIMPGAGLKSWWSQTEGLLALAYAAALSGDEEFLEEFVKLDDWTWRHFRDPEYPEWFTSVTAGGVPVGVGKGMPTKTFFHLPRCLFHCASVLRSLARR